MMFDESTDIPLDLSTQQLRTFCAVHEHGGYSAAARESGQSTTALWEHVKELERQYGTTLFIRRGRQVVCTPAAERLYEIVKPLLAGLETTRRVVLEEQGDRPREIRIAVGVRMLIEEVSVGLEAFRRKNPDIRLAIREVHSHGAQGIVEENEADLVMSLQPGPGYLTNAVEVEEAYETEYVVIAPARHPLRQLKSIRLSDVVEHPLVLWRPDIYSRRVFEQALHEKNLLDRMTVAAETDNSAFTAAAVRAGMGVGIIAGQPNGILCKGLFVKSLSRVLGRPKIVFLWRRGALVSPVLRELADTIRATVRELFRKDA